MLRRIRQMRGKYVKVGVFGPEALTPQPFYDGKSTAEIALQNELGEGTTPSRSFLRDTVDDKIKVIHKEAKKQAWLVLLHRRTPVQGLKDLGTFVVEKVKERIHFNIPPPLSPRTVAEKGHDQALVRTRHMVESIRREVS
jgi:hypothetical protein